MYWQFELGSARVAHLCFLWCDLGFLCTWTSAGRAGTALKRASRPLANCSKHIHVVAEGFPATRENKPCYASTFPVSARVQRSRWPQQATRPSQSCRWQGPAEGVDTGQRECCRGLMRWSTSRSLSGVLPGMKAAMLLALFAFLLETVAWHKWSVD